MSKGVENFKRRTWDTAEAERLAIERQDRERSGVRQVPKEDDEVVVDTSFAKLHYADINAAKPAGSSKAFLDVEKAREGLDLDSKVGKVEKVAGGARQAGYHCALCDRTFQDSLALLDHMNGREHQSRLGFSMHVAASSKTDVASRIQAQMKKAVYEASQGKPQQKAEVRISLDDKLKQAEEEIQQAKQAKAAKRKKQRVVGQREEEEEAVSSEVQQDEIDPGLQKMLGFTSFGSSN